MHGQTVKDEHIARVDLAAHPIAPDVGLGRNLRDVKVLIFMMYVAMSMGTLHNPEGPYVRGAIVKRNPSGEAFGISAHEPVILVCVNGKALAVRKNQPANRLRMN